MPNVHVHCTCKPKNIKTLCSSHASDGAYVTILSSDSGHVGVSISGRLSAN